MKSNNFSNKLFNWFKYYDPEEKEISYAKKIINLQNKNILEIGCATGKTTLQICNSSKNYFAIDKDPRVINFCKKKFSTHNCNFLLNDVENLIFKDNSFDIIISPWVFNYIKNKTKALNEISRVLKNKGHFLLIESSENCDFDKILKDIIDISSIDPIITYEIPIKKQFKLIKKKGPVPIPYIFPSISKAFKLMKFIVEDYLNISLTTKQKNILKSNLMQFQQKDNKIIFYEKPLFLLFEK